MPKQSAFPGLGHAKEDAHAAGDVPRGDGRDGALDSAPRAERAALSQGGAQGQASADAAGDDAVGVLSPEVVCVQ